MARKGRRDWRWAVALGVATAITVAGRPAAGATLEGQTVVANPVASPGLDGLPVEDAPTRGARSLGREAAQLLAEARRLSPTVRRLLATLEASDLLVYVELRIPRGSQTGQLTVLGRGAGVRYLKIEIYGVYCPKARIPWLAHELQHAVEIAAAPEVTDDAGLRRLYARIGRPCLDRPDGFETTAAIDVRTRVIAELASPPDSLAAGRLPR